MSTDPSKDPIPYRKDLRKKMDLEDEDSKSSNDQSDQNESNPKNEEHME